MKKVFKNDLEVKKERFNNLFLIGVLIYLPIFILLNIHYFINSVSYASIYDLPVLKQNRNWNDDEYKKYYSEYEKYLEETKRNTNDENIKKYNDLSLDAKELVFYADARKERELKEFFKQVIIYLLLTIILFALPYYIYKKYYLTGGIFISLFDILVVLYLDFINMFSLEIGITNYLLMFIPSIIMIIYSIYMWDTYDKKILKRII